MSKKTYEARPGVDWVNGQRVPKNRLMKLSAAEAKFDLAQGRIVLKDEETSSKPADQTKPSEPAKVTDPSKSGPLSKPKA